MIILYHGVLQLLVTTSALVVVFSSNTTDSADKISQDSKNLTDGKNTSIPVKSVAELVKSHRRAPRFNTAESSPWVRVYNRPPGTEDSFYNYETRGNTSGHTSGEVWDKFLDEASTETSVPIERSDVKVKDILRVKPKVNEVAAKADVPKSRTRTESSQITTSTTTKSPVETAKQIPTRNDSEKRGYIVWPSSDGRTPRPTADKTGSTEDRKLEPSIDSIVPNDGNNWKVIGDGGEGGWEVVGDKGEVEWKIEYDDGEWRVISNGDIPADAEWIDPEYTWESAEGSQADDYNSWPADEYAVPNWPGNEAYPQTIKNESWYQESGNENRNDGKQNSAGKPTEIYNPVKTNEKIKFGARHKIPSQLTADSSIEERTNAEISEENRDATGEETPQNDQLIFTGKTFIPDTGLVKNGQNWIQGYGTKTWEADNTGWNAGTSGETWVAANKNFAPEPWIPKIPGSKSSAQKDSKEESNRNTQDNTVRAWGTGYGSKTWKGNEWNSNVVWKTGYNGLPWDADNSTWKFPEQSKGKNKPQVWSQPIPSNIESPEVKASPPPTKGLDVIRVKWPTKTVNRDQSKKLPPSRRTESESWAGNDNTAGVIWKINDGDAAPMPDEYTPKTDDQNSGWQNIGWKVSTTDDQQKPMAAPWKSNAPPKSSNLVSLNWKAGGDDTSAVTWNQGQWPDVSIEPTWIFRGCKMTLKCGSTDNVDSDDSDQSNTPDTSDDDTMTTLPPTTPSPINIGKFWPPRPNKGKSWKPPPKSWKPPKWKQPTPTPPPPPPETMDPTMIWKSPPTPAKSWKKPTPPSKWKQPPPTIMWTETTPALPEISWKPPPLPPPPMKWKKGPRPTKSWKPPPTKSWRPPKIPKTWKPSIATPPPDIWPTTKPDCKDTTDATPPPTESEDEDLMEPPQIIIITQLPKKPTDEADDTKDRDDAKRKPPFGPWVFPPRKNSPKSSNNRKDKNIPINISKGQPKRPNKSNFKIPNRIKGWPKDIPPPKFYWPNTAAMRRWTTKGPQSFAGWRPKYSRSRTWKQMLKNWING